MPEKAFSQFVVAIVVAAASAALPGVAGAQDGLWRARTQIYGWALASPAADLPLSGGAASNADAQSGESEARFGRFGLWSEGVALRLGASAPSGANPLVGTRTGYAPGSAWTLAGSYAAVETPTVDVYTLAGLRHLSAEGAPAGRTGLGLAAPVSRAEAWDAILGVRGRVKLGEGRWFAPYYFDVGAGQSDLTWQAFGGIGYAFSWGEIVGSWRHLDYNFASTNPSRDLSFSGPTISFGYRW